MIDSNEENGHNRIGIAVLCGILTFLLLEKVLELSNPETNPELREAGNKKIVGYLNLLANCTDNLLHGLAVGSWKSAAHVWAASSRIVWSVPDASHSRSTP